MSEPKVYLKPTRRRVLSDHDLIPPASGPALMSRRREGARHWSWRRPNEYFYYRVPSLSLASSSKEHMLMCSSNNTNKQANNNVCVSSSVLKHVPWRARYTLIKPAPMVGMQLRWPVTPKETAEDAPPTNNVHFGSSRLHFVSSRLHFASCADDVHVASTIISALCIMCAYGCMCPCRPPPQLAEAASAHLAQ